MMYLIAVIVILFVIVLFLLFYSPKSRTAGQQEQFETVADRIAPGGEPPPSQQEAAEDASQAEQELTVEETLPPSGTVVEEELELAFEEEVPAGEAELSLSQEREGPAGEDMGEIAVEAGPAGNEQEPAPEVEVEEREDLEEIPLAADDGAVEHRKAGEKIAPALAGFTEESAAAHDETPEELAERLDYFFGREEDAAAEPAEAAGLTPEVYRDEMDSLVARYRSQLADAIEQQDTAAVARLETRLVALCSNRADIRKSLQEQQGLLAAIEEMSHELERALPDTDLAGVRQHLLQREYETVIGLLDEACGGLGETPQLVRRCRYLCGRLAESEADFSGALAMYQKACTEDGGDLPSLAAAGRAAAMLGNDEAARQMLEERVDRGRQQEEQSVELAGAQHELARVLARQEAKDMAEPLFKESLRILEQERGADHPDLGPVLHDLAALYESLGRYEEAEPLYKRALAVTEASAPEHPRLAATMNRLAGLYEEMEQEEKAGPLYARALEIKKGVLGEDHPDVGTMLNHLANLLKMEGKYEEAEPMFRRSLEIGEKALGPDHPNLAVVLNNMAELYSETGREEDAERCQERALALFELPVGSGDFVEMERDELNIGNGEDKTVVGR